MIQRLGKTTNPFTATGRSTVCSTQPKVVDPLGQTIAAIGRMPVGPVNDHGEDQSQGIDHQVPLASGDRFPCIVAPLFASLGSANRLAVDNCRGRRGLLACRPTDTL